VSGPYRRTYPADPAPGAVAPRPAGGLSTGTSDRGRLTAAVYTASRSPAPRLQALMDTILSPGPNLLAMPPQAARGESRRPPTATEAGSATGSGEHREHREPRPQPIGPRA
jgi:hypothetical protein